MQLAFGLFPLFGKWAFVDFHPMTIATLRVCFGAAAFFAIALARCARAAFPARADLPALFALAMLGVAFNQGLYLEGLRRTSAVNTALLMCLIPVMTYAIAVCAGHEALSRRKIAGIALALLGAAPLVARKGDVSGDVLGNFLILGNVLCYSLYMVFSKPMMRRYPPLVVACWVYVFSLAAVPAFLAFGPAWPASPPHPRALGALAYVLAFPTVVAYLFNLFALKRVPASTAAIFINLQPFISGVAAHYGLDEPLEARSIACAIPLFAGLWLVAGGARSGAA